ncbi:MAG: ureidoglycolate lyase [Prochloraceae cyanobacterium]
MNSPDLISESSAIAIYELPLIAATPDTLQGYGKIVSDFHNCEIEIVTWPASGWRPVDPGTGNQGGITEGVFEFWWQGDILYGANHAVDGQYLLGWSRRPETASTEVQTVPRDRVLIWHANYHPDGGQLFFPQDGKPFVVPLALSGDNLKPEDFVAFYCDGSFGLYIHPNIWHEAVFPLCDAQKFFDKQGKVHARISCNLVQEFSTYLSVPLQSP